MTDPVLFKRQFRIDARPHPAQISASTYAMLQATAYLRRLVQDRREMSELARKTKINLNRLDQFVAREEFGSD